MVIHLPIASSSNEKSQEVNLNQTERLSSLITSFDEKVMINEGGYSWGYLDSKTGQMVKIAADSMPSIELVNVEGAVGVKTSESILLNFKKEPLHYEIRVCDNNAEMIATYKHLKDIKEEGKVIYEILATWGEGKGTYTVALDIQ